MKHRIRRLWLLMVINCLIITPQARAVLANAWHIPDNSGDLGFAMRNPEFEIGPASTVTVYSGIQKFNNSYGTANQTGGWLIYKGVTQGAWSSNALAFYLNSVLIPNNQYWKSSFNTSAFGTNEVIQYYLYLTFDGVNGVSNTYVFGRDAGSSTTATQSVAQASPFTIRNRPAWLFHGGNRVLNPGSDASHGNVDLLVKTGYVGKDDSVASRYATTGGFISPPTAPRPPARSGPAATPRKSRS